MHQASFQCKCRHIVTDDLVAQESVLRITVPCFLPSFSCMSSESGNVFIYILKCCGHAANSNSLIYRFYNTYIAYTDTTRTGIKDKKPVQQVYNRIYYQLIVTVAPVYNLARSNIDIGLFTKCFSSCRQSTGIILLFALSCNLFFLI